MRSKEEIALIASEIHEAVQKKLMIEDMSRVIKKYAPNVMHTIGLAGIINMGTNSMIMAKRHKDAIAKYASVQDTFENYKMRVREQYSIKPE